MDKPNSSDFQPIKTLTGTDRPKDREVLFSLLFDNSRDGIVVVDNKGRFINANKAYCSMLGYTIDELLSMDDFYAITPEKWREWEREEIWNNRLMKIGYSGVYEKEYVRKNGEGFPVELNSFTIFETDGNPSILCASVRDITERKKIEYEREQYYKLFRTASDLMVVADPNGAFMKTNTACTEVLGYSEAELVAKPFVEYIHPDDKQPTIDEMARQLQRGFSLNFENRYICKDGSVKWLSWRAFFNKDEGITYATARDITSLKTAEDELENIFALSSDMICIADINGYFKRINPAWERTLGYTNEELLNKPYIDLVHPDDKEMTIAAGNENLLLGHNVFNFENRYRCKDGTYRWLMWTSNPAIEKGITYAIAKDITDRKAAEEERYLMLADLQKALSEIRTLHLMLPICSYCKKIRDDKGYWEGVETYISKHTDTVFSHGACPECAEKAFKEFEQSKKQEGN